MPADPELINNVAGNLLSGTAAGHLRRERFADAAASNLIAGMNLIVEKGRQAFAMVSDLVTYRIADGLTGSSNSLTDSILAARAVQFQPNEMTFSDPNYRAGASAPPGTKAQ